MNFVKRYGLWILLIAGIFLRILALNQSFWLDEATSGVVVRDLSFWEIIYKFLPADFHPPLYYLALKIWSLVFGYGEVSLRSLSLVTGVATIYLLYLIGKKLNFKNSLIAPLLLTTSGLHLYYSTEARMYSLATLFVCLSFYHFLKLANERIRVKDWVFFGLSITLAVGTHYLTFLILPVFLLYALLNKQNLSWWKRLFISHLFLITGFILWFPILLKQLGGGLNVGNASPLWARVLGQTSLKEILLVFVKFFLGRISFENNIVYGGIVLAVVVPAIFLLLKVVKSYKTNSLILLWFFVPLISGAAIGLFVPVFSYFRFLFILPVFYLILSAGIVKAKSSKMWSFLFVSINLISSLYFLINVKFHKEDWRSLVSVIEKSRSANSQVLFVANSQMEGYKYYSKDAKIQGPEDLDPNSEEIWLVRYVKEIFDPEDNLKTKVESLGFKKVDEYDFNGIPVLRYENSN